MHRETQRGRKGFLEFISKIRFSILLIFSVLALVCGAWYFDRANDGFTLGGIFSEHSIMSDQIHASTVRALSANEERLVASIFDQDFTYLGRGGQFYAFASQDGQHVLKFFRYKRFRHEPWLDYFDFIPFIDDYRLNRIQKKRQKLEKVIKSCVVAFNFLKESSGLELIHFTKTKNLNKTVKIIDKRGNHHLVDLDEMEFVVQKKAQLLGPNIDDLMVLGDITGTKYLLSNTVNMIYSESLQGIIDQDPAFMQNTGVLEDRPIHIDIGQITIDEEAMHPDRARQEVRNKTFKLNRWLKAKYPELSQHLEAEIDVVGKG